MPLAVMAPVYSAIVAGGAGVGASVVGSRAQSGANKRALAASTAANAKAEAFERDQDAQNRADAARVEAEDRRRWDIEQQNTAAEKAQADALLRDQLARQDYADQIAYQKRVNIARLTGQAPPQPMPTRTSLGGGAMPTPMTIGSLAQGPTSGVLASRPSQAGAMIAAPGAAGPFSAPPSVLGQTPMPVAQPTPPRWPIRRLSGRRI